MIKVIASDMDGTLLGDDHKPAGAGDSGGGEESV